MKRLILCIILLIFTVGWASAATSVWKVQKGTTTIYLGGTIHVLRETDFPPPPEFEQAYKASQTVIFETDIARLKEPAAQQLLLAKAVYSDGSTIDQHLSPQAYRELSAYCEANGIPLQSLRQLKPSMLMTTLTYMELVKLGVSQQGIDAHFYQQAKKDGKAVRGLETVEQQINFVVSMADGIENEVVTYSIRDMKNLGDQFETLISAWRSGDADRLGELLVSELKTRWPQLYKKLISDRNRNWLPQIDALQKKRETTLVLVGAAHLVGPDGLISALRKKGYTVERL